MTAQQQAQAQLTEAQEELARAREQVASAELQAQQITDSVEEVQRTIETRTQNLLTTVAAFEEDIAEARARLAEIPELRQRQESLEADFRALRERIGFEQSAALPAELQARLEELFTRYFRYLDDAGFPQEPGLVTVTVDPNLQSNAYYMPGDRTVVIGGNIADDLDVPLREYTHHLLLTAHPGGGSIEPSLSVESALADYFPASFTDDPHIGEVFARTVELGQPYIRSLDNARRFEEIEPSSGMHDAGEVWGGAFWQIRDTIGQRAADRLFAHAWLTFAPSQGSQNHSAEFIAHLLDTARALQEIEDVEPIRAVFERRGFPLSGG